MAPVDEMFGRRRFNCLRQRATSEQNMLQQGYHRDQEKVTENSSSVAVYTATPHLADWVYSDFLHEALFVFEYK
jgi:hypothetical protein